MAGKRSRVFAAAAAAAAAAVLAAAASRVASAQSNQVMTSQNLVLRPWQPDAYGETDDRLFFERKGHVNDASPGPNGGDDDTHVFFWDSTGRFRFDKLDDRPLSLAYRWTTISFSNPARQGIPDHLDDVALAGGAHLGDYFGGDLALVGGVGYSGDSPFGNSHGLYGIGHVTWKKDLSDADALALTLDYDGNRALLPDAPLPGFAWMHRTNRLNWGTGFPENWIEAEVAPRLMISADYTVPHTADARAEYHLNRYTSVFGGYSHFFNAFATDDRPVTDRIFFAMDRAEVGLRYNGKVAGFDVDAALTIGYAFDQHFDRGYDVRGLDRISSISDEPYIGLTVVGKI